MKGKEVLGQNSRENNQEELLVERPYTLKNLLGVPLIILNVGDSVEDINPGLSLSPDFDMNVPYIQASDDNIEYAEYVDIFGKKQVIAVYTKDVKYSCFNIPVEEDNVYYVVSEAIKFAFPERTDFVSPIVSAVHFPGVDEPRMFCVGLRGDLPLAEENSAPELTD